MKKIVQNAAQMFFGNESEEKKNEKMRKQYEKKMKASIIAQLKPMECDMKLQKCDEEFREVIEREKTLLRQRELYNQSTAECRNRIRQAAIGRVVVRSARAELQQAANEDRLNRARNALGVSVRQLYKLYGTEVKEKNNEAILSMLGTSEEDQEYIKAYLEKLEQYEVSPETENLVGNEFVNEFIKTGKFDLCLERSRRRLAEQRRLAERCRLAERKEKAEEEARKQQETDRKSPDMPDMPDEIDPDDIRKPEGEDGADEISSDTEDYEEILRENADFA